MRISRLDCYCFIGMFLVAVVVVCKGIRNTLWVVDFIEGLFN